VKIKGDVPNGWWHWISSGKQFDSEKKYEGWTSKDDQPRAIVDGEYESCAAFCSLEFNRKEEGTQGKLYDLDCNRELYSLCQQVFP
jgi:hypothetical protein